MSDAANASIYITPADEVRIPLAATCLGLSEKAIRRKIEDGVWREKHEYFRRDGEIWVSLKGVSRWVRGGREAA